MTVVESPKGEREVPDVPKKTTARTRLEPRALVPLAITWWYAIFSLYPMVWLVAQSLKSDQEFFTTPWSIVPSFNVSGYVSALENASVGRYYLNSIFVTAVATTCVVLFSLMAGYAFSQLHFPGRGLLYKSLFVVLLVPAPVLLLPVFIIANMLGILNSHLGLIAVYIGGGMPISIYLMKTAFDASPKELIEASKVDGCGDWQTFWRVMAPLIRPVIATVAILEFMGSWNEYMWAFVSLRDANLYTLPVGIVDLASKVYIHGYNTTFAAMVMTALPVIIGFIVAQRSFVRALTSGAVKG